MRFTVKRKKPLCQFDQGGFEHNNPGLLAVASSPGLRYEIVVGYVELLPTRLTGGEGKRSLSSI